MLSFIFSRSQGSLLFRRKKKKQQEIVPTIFHGSKLFNYLIYRGCIQILKIIDVQLVINTRFIQTYYYRYNNTTTYSYIQDNSII